MAVEVNTERKLVEVSYDVGDSTDENIVVEAIGQADDVHTTGERPNSGLVVLSYPHDFMGTSSVTVLGAESGEEIDSGDITV